tara:strand:+ start:1914 stop:2552 length:639 start_codon:yes stop_codon:yes gene_type:complete
MSQNICRVDLFPDPIFIVRDLLGENQRMKLQEDCYAWKDSSPGLQRTNSGGWHSEDTIFIRDEDSFKILKKNIINQVGIIVRNIDKSFDSSKNLQIKSEGWVNINKGTDFNSPHDHAGNTLSGCYYVKIPKRILSTISTSGYIQFLDPNIGVNSDSVKIFRSMRNGFIQPQEDVLLLFPSWLKHMVHPHREQEDRISIAFNLSIKICDKPLD